MYQIMINRKKIGKPTDFIEVARLRLQFQETAYIQYSKEAIKAINEARKNAA